MGAKNKAVAAGAAAKAAKDNAYVNKLIEDEELRQNIWQAYEAARDAYGRLGNGKSPAKAIFDDKKLQKDLRQAAESIREASFALREAPKSKKSGGGLMRKLLLVTVAGGLALALSEGLRKKVLDALFGAEEEFEYTSTTSTPTTNSTSSTTTASTPAGSTS
jgi:hypothetical protein